MVPPMDANWTHIKTILEKTLSPGLYNLWIKPLGANIVGDALVIDAPNEFVAAWVRERLTEAVTEAASSVLGRRPTVRVNAAAPGRESARPEAGPTPAATHLALPMAASAVPKPDRDRFRFSFDDFVVGPSNELAYAASRELCDMTLAADQLFICSGPGLGKTHLLQAIGRRVCLEKAQTGPRVAYLTAEEFANRMVMAIKAREIERFKASFRENVDVLLLEDIHFFRDKPRIQDELLNTLKALRSRGCTLVFTSSFLPRELTGLDGQLISRFASGFIAVIDKPDLATRKRILRRKAAIHQVLLPEEVADILAGNLRDDIRQLESCLQNLVLKARLLNMRINAEMAWDVLANYDLAKKPPGLDDIVSYVCDVYDVKASDLCSKSRKRQHVLARNTAFFLARRHTELSLGDIGERFGRRHSTVIKGITSLEKHLSLKTPLGRELETTLSQLGQ